MARSYCIVEDGGEAIAQELGLEVEGDHRLVGTGPGMHSLHSPTYPAEMVARLSDYSP